MDRNFNGMIDCLSSLSTDELDDLKDEINDEIKRREHKHFIELKENAIQALNNYFQAGGCIVNNKSNFNFGIDEELMSVGEGDCIYLR